MSVAGILSSSFLSSLSQNAQTSSSTKTNGEKFHNELAQLGQDLYSGTASAAKSDLTALQQTSTSVSTAASKDISQLSTDLNSGNLTAAQQDYASLRNDLKHGTIKPASATGDTATSTGTSAVPASSSTSSSDQLMQQLSQALQAGNLNAAQLAYTNLGSQLFLN
jgi:hypothetical protein